MNSVIAFGPLGTQEMVLIFLIMLLLFGAKKLPQLARGIGKSVGEFLSWLHNKTGEWAR